MNKQDGPTVDPAGSTLEVVWQSTHCGDLATIDGEPVPREDVVVMKGGPVLLRGEPLDGALIDSFTNDSRARWHSGGIWGFERGPTTLSIHTAAYAAKLNPGIRKTVELLQSNGFATCDSGDGKTHDFECDRDGAYVCIECDPERLVHECRRLKLVLAQAGVSTEPIGSDGPSVQGSFDPANGTAVIELMGVDDSMLCDPAVDSVVGSMTLVGDRRQYAANEPRRSFASSSSDEVDIPPLVQRSAPLIDDALYEHALPPGVRAPAVPVDERKHQHKWLASVTSRSDGSWRVDEVFCDCGARDDSNPLIGARVPPGNSDRIWALSEAYKREQSEG